jgi:hypothetical protein
MSRTSTGVMLVTQLDLGVVPDLYSAGLTEDGEDYIAEKYYILAEDQHGNRWTHGKNFLGAKRCEDEDGFGYEDVREVALAAAEKLLQKIRSAGAIDLDYWHEDRPAYGSAAYCAYGQADDVAWEKK